MNIKNARAMFSGTNINFTIYLYNIIKDSTRVRKYPTSVYYITPMNQNYPSSVYYITPTPLNLSQILYIKQEILQNNPIFTYYPKYMPMIIIKAFFYKYVKDMAYSWIWKFLTFSCRSSTLSIINPTILNIYFWWSLCIYLYLYSVVCSPVPTLSDNLSYKPLIKYAEFLKNSSLLYPVSQKLRYIGIKGEALEMVSFIKIIKWACAQKQSLKMHEVIIK